MELILDVPDLPRAKSHDFHRIIHQEVLAAGEATDRVAAEYAASTRPGPLVRMRAQDFLDAVRRKAGDRLGLSLQVEPAEDALWIRLDGTSMALALVFVLERLGAEFGHTVSRCRLEAKDRFVGIDFIWPGPPLRLETLHRWGLQPVSVSDEGLRFTLKEILARHRAELWSQSLGNTSESYLRLLLETVERLKPAIPGSIPSWPPRVRSTTISTSSISRGSHPNWTTGSWRGCPTPFSTPRRPA